MEKNRLEFNIQFFAKKATSGQEDEKQMPEGSELEDEDTKDETIDPLENVDEDTAQALDDLQEALDAESQKVKDLTEAYDALIEKIKNLLADLGVAANETSSEEDIQALKDKVTELQAANIALTTENDSLTAQLVEIKQQKVKSIIEKILDKKIALGDITEADRNTEREKLLKRTEDSLNDTLDDLSRRQPIRVIEKVNNPALADNSQKGVITVMQEEASKEQETGASKEEKPVQVKVFRSLFTGEKDVTKFLKGGNK